MPFFSVVIPLFNKEKFIGKAIESVMAQTFSDFEVIIVDDASTDSGVKTARNYESASFRIIAHEKNKGLSAARNTGIRSAKADFVAFLDADDIWKPDFLEKIATLIKRFPQAGVFATGYEETYGNKALEIHKNLGFVENEMAVVTDFFLASSYQPIFCYSCVAIKKEVFENVGYFDENITLGEDVDFNIRAFMKYDLAYFNGICASYTIFSENQITTSRIDEKTVTDFDKYEKLVSQRQSLKKYLDVNRYALAMNYKLSRNKVRFKQMSGGITRKNLTKRQRLMLKAPAFFVRLIRSIKGIFLNRGYRLTTFRK